MSKYILRKRTSNFTIVSNDVINVLSGNLEALGLYLYLLSLPDEWNFYKTQLCKQFSIGIKKLEKLLKILNSFQLIQYGQKRNEKGQFATFYIDIYDLESIKNKDLEESSPEGQNGRTVKTDGRSGEAIKETLQNKKKIIKKERGENLKNEVFTLSQSDSNYIPDKHDYRMEEQFNVDLCGVFTMFIAHLRNKNKKKFTRHDWKIWLMREIQFKNNRTVQ